MTYLLQVTTRREKLEEEIKRVNPSLVIGIDGTVPNATDLYDQIFDHHREGGADIQLDEVAAPLGLLQYQNYIPYTLLVTTQVDADAIIAAHWLIYTVRYTVYGLSVTVSDETYQFLRAISYDCDHLCVPSDLNRFADDAAMVVAALKQEGNAIAQELNLPTNRREWSIEDKEEYSSICFKRGVQRIDDLLKGEWNYREIAHPYWIKVKENEEIIQSQERIKRYCDCLIFNQVGMSGYIDPRCWIRSITGTPKLPITLTQREVWADNKFQGYSYTLGTVPLHPEQKNWDYTKEIFDALTEAERKNNPNADGWGGRATVGGSGWNTPSTLSPEEVIDIVLNA